MDGLYAKYVNLIILLQSFQINWQRFFFSNGNYVYVKECKKSASLMIELFRILHEDDKSIHNSKAIGFNSDDDDGFASEVIQSLNDWTLSEDIFPHFDDIKNITSYNFYLNEFIVCETSYLLRKINPQIHPVLYTSSHDSCLNENYIKWHPHVSYLAVDFFNIDFLDEMSKSNSITIVADIRKSQELITYSSSPQYFRDKLLTLLEDCKAIIKDHSGIFDRFTGDGFICYFNENLCNIFDLNYYQCAVSAIASIQKRANEIFPEWVADLKKVPIEKIGLSIGVDEGEINYSEKNGHFIAIGEPSVWATRMCSAALADEVIVNNRPYNKLMRMACIESVSEVNSTTKGGENFLAHKVQLKDIFQSTRVHFLSGDKR